MGTYIRLIDIKDPEEKEKEFFNPDNRYTVDQNDFKKIPGNPIAYWVSERVWKIFSDFKTLGEIASPKIGMRTGDNNRFLRVWYEISKSKTKFPLVKKDKKWVPYNKGGTFKKWYGNFEYVVNWEKNGFEIKKNTLKNYPQLSWDNLGWKISNERFYFKEGVTWTDLSSSGFGVRYLTRGFIFDAAGPCLFGEQPLFYLAFLLTKQCFEFLKILNPTFHFKNYNIEALPIIEERIQYPKIKSIALKAIDISKSDWDAYERSWDFTKLPLLKSEFKQPTIEESYSKLRQHWKEMTLEMRKLEEENNRIFIEAYGLEDELTPEVPLEEITLTCNPWYRYSKKCDDFGDGFPIDEELEDRLLTDTMKELISYAVGCMFGRYSPDKPGLILANQGETLDDFREKVPDAGFLPDENNIIPILDADYFRDDIVTYFRRFLAYTFGEKNLSENLEFVADAIRTRKKRRPAEEEIRYYFTRHFFKDHCRTYKKRPIYWLFSTGGRRRSFQALIYMHRYDKTTLARLRHAYLLEFESKCQARLEILREDDSAPARRKKKLQKYIEDMVEYDELLKSKADEYIEIDLDDGVKQNYPGFKGLLRKI